MKKLQKAVFRLIYCSILVIGLWHLLAPDSWSWLYGGAWGAVVFLTGVIAGGIGKIVYDEEHKEKD